LLANAISLDTLFQVFTGCHRSFTLLLRVYHSIQSFDQVKKGKNLMVAKVSFDRRSRSLAQAFARSDWLAVSASNSAWCSSEEAAEGAGEPSAAQHRI